MSSSDSCPRCANELTAVAGSSGLCVECFLSTGAIGHTLAVDPRTRIAASPLASTVTYDPRGETLLFVDRSADSSLSIARAAKLADAHGFVDVCRMNASGGMGELYRAYDPAAARPVVVKFVRPMTESQPNSRKRFVVEARALARVQHENVARLFAFVEADDPYFVMEDVEGGSLNERLVDGPLAPAVAAKILAAAARGVAAANREGVIHRDLKPGNILLTSKSSEAVPKVADFGIAKDLDSVETLTGTTAVMGTPGYMSPEQADWRSSECDARTDVWGLAATLYCCVTGQPPFDRNLRPQSILKAPLIPPVHVRPDTPRELNAVICKGLEKDPADRYSTADAFADDLDRFLAGRPVQARPRPLPMRVWRRARRVPKSLAAAVLLAISTMIALVAVVLLDRKAAAVSEPTPDQKLDVLMGELKKGKPVTLVGQTGLPVWHTPLVGNYAMIASDTVQGSCAIESVSTGVCKLLTQMPIQSYELRMELCDIASSSNNLAGEFGYRLGLIFGLDSVVQADGPRMETGFAIRFNDQDNAFFKGLPPAPIAVSFDHLVMSEEPGNGVAIQQTGIAFIRDNPSRKAGTGLWRPIRVNVSPAGIEAFWGHGDQPANRIVKLTAAELDDNIAAAETSMRRSWRPGAMGPLPRWAPDRPVAILCHKCAVGIRNVVVTPTPAP